MGVRCLACQVGRRSIGSVQWSPRRKHLTGHVGKWGKDRGIRRVERVSWTKSTHKERNAQSSRDVDEQKKRDKKKEKESRKSAQVEEPADLKSQAHRASSEDDWAPTRPPAFRPSEEPDVTDEPREGGGTHQMMLAVCGVACHCVTFRSGARPAVVRSYSEYSSTKKAGGAGRCVPRPEGGRDSSGLRVERVNVTNREEITREKTNPPLLVE